MNELEQKLADVLESINTTFGVEIAEKRGEDDDTVVTKLTLRGLTGDGSEFIEKFCALFGPLIEQASDGERELVFEEERGLTVKRTS